MASVMSGTFTVRRAASEDLEAIASLIDEFVKGHPAEGHSRPIAVLREAYFGESPLSRLFIAERSTEPIGFGGWKRTFDMFWAMHGGEADGLFVKPAYRGRGV